MLRTYRVSGIVINSDDDADEQSDDACLHRTRSGSSEEDPALTFGDQRAALLWGSLDLCFPAEQRCFWNHNDLSGSDTSLIPAALQTIKVDMLAREDHSSSPILGPLTSRYHAALLRSLRSLTIEYNKYDESGSLETFANLATHLSTLSLFCCCGLRSVRGLEGRCEYLQKVNLAGCGRLLRLAGLGHHLFLEEVNASSTAINSLEPLRTCPALRTVVLTLCKQLSSLDGLQQHEKLQTVGAQMCRALESLEALRTCPGLMRVKFSDCTRLSSIDGLQGHRWLQDVHFSHTPIVSVEPLRTCPALKKVVLECCRELAALEGLEGHQWLEEVEASRCSSNPSSRCARALH